jgi:hypothetical protein
MANFTPERWKKIPGFGHGDFWYEVSQYGDVRYAGGWLPGTLKHPTTVNGIVGFYLMANDGKPKRFCTIDLPSAFFNE